MRAGNVTLADKLKARRQEWKDGAPERARLREVRRVEAEKVASEREEVRLSRMAEMPRFIVRQTREVLVAAEDMNDAIALANAAFKEGQDDDGTIKWRKPFGVEGDTIEKIKTLNVKATEVEEYEY